MKDFLQAGLVYVPAFIIGRQFSHYIDPFLAGWIVASAAVIIRGAYFRAFARS